MNYDSIVWEWPERRRLEHLQLWTFEEGIKAEGLIVVDSEKGPIRFRYSVVLKLDWQSLGCHVIVPTKSTQKSISLACDEVGGWMVDQKGRADLTDCVAFDLLDSPFPKTGLVKFLQLEAGDSKTIRVAVLDNRRLIVTPVDQRWERLPDHEGEQRYRCTMDATTSEFRLNEQLLVTFSPARWRIRTRPTGFGSAGAGAAHPLQS